MGDKEIKLPTNLTYREIRKILEKNIEKFSNHLDSLKNVVRSYEKNTQVVSPALRWAQNREFITIEVKFSHRLDSPGCLELENLIVDISYDKILSFSGYCFLGDVPIKFEMDLKLFEEINRLNSSWNSISVGKFMINLKKKHFEKWPSLLRDGENIPNNQHLWLERQQEFDEIESKDKDNSKKEHDDDDDDYERFKKPEKKKSRRPNYNSIGRVFNDKDNIVNNY
jgi:hypothetical protein